MAYVLISSVSIAVSQTTNSKHSLIYRLSTMIPGRIHGIRITWIQPTTYSILCCLLYTHMNTLQYVICVLSGNLFLLHCTTDIHTCISTSSVTNLLQSYELTYRHTYLHAVTMVTFIETAGKWYVSYTVAEVTI